MKCENLKCQVLQIRVCAIEMVVTSLALIYITFDFGIPIPIKRVSETTTVILCLFISMCTPNDQVHYTDYGIIMIFT